MYACIELAFNLVLFVVTELLGFLSILLAVDQPELPSGAVAAKALSLPKWGLI